MRISDWSSDVCSSDLFRVGLGKLRNQLLHIGRFTHGSIELAGRITYPAKIRAHSNQAALYAGPGNSRDDFIIEGAAMRPDERRVGKGVFRTRRSWWSPEH